MRYTQTQPVASPPPGERLPVDRISPRPSLHFAHEQTTLQQLAESIRVYGLRRPVTVRRTGAGRYVIVSGNRRLMACRMLGMPHISARILAEDAHRQPANQLIDALITRRLHYLEAAEAMRVLHERHGMPRGALANLLELHPKTVAEQMRLTEFDDELQAFLMDEGVPLCIALTLLRIPDERTRMSVARRIAGEQLCVRDAALLASAASVKRGKCEGVSYQEKNTRLAMDSQNPPRIVRGVMRDRRLYLNAIRDIAGQMQAVGVDAIVTEQCVGSRMELTVSVPLRHRRAARYQVR